MFSGFNGLTMENRAYSFLKVKSVDEEKRMISGIASTPEIDRQGDIVDPMGVEIPDNVPLLWMHDHSLPVGKVKFGLPSKKGIPFTATIPVINTPAGLKARVDEAWESVKSGLIAAVSIGFRPLEWSINEVTGGYNFIKSEVLELSLVAVPANAGATISQIKSMDESCRAALGKEAAISPDTKLSGVAEKTNKQVKLTPKEGKKMTTEEQIKQFLAERAAKAAKMEEIMKKSGDSGETLDDAQSEEYDTLESEVESIDKHLSRLEKLQKAKAVSAKPVLEKSGQSEKGALEARHSVQVKAPEQLEKGVEFARYVMCQAAARGDAGMALNLAKTHYGNNDRIIKTLEFQAGGGRIDSVMRSVVTAGTTLDSTWAAPLVQYQDFAGDFVEFLRPRTIIGQFGVGNIPSLNRIPFNVRIPAQTSGGDAYWVGEGAPKPLTEFNFDTEELRWAKVATIAVITDELIRFSNPSAERLVRDSLARAVIARIDTDFIDPAKIAASNVSPASITNGATTIASSGTDADAVRCDIQALWAPFIAARNAPRNAVYIMNSTNALALSLMQNPLGQSEFPGVTMNGGTFMGVPVIVSDYVPVGIVVLANASDIWLADDGQVTVDASREASLQMLDSNVGGAGAPTNNSATGTPTTVVSMFQTNSVAIRAERYINWARRRASGVAYLTGVEWGVCPTS